MANPLHSFASDNADVNLAAGATIFSEANAGSVPRWVTLDIVIGDGTKDLTADSETTLTFQVSNGGVAGEEIEVTVPSGQDRFRIQTDPILWINSETLALTCLSSNAGDTDVDCTVTARDAAPLQAATSDRTVGINASGHVERVTLVDTTAANSDMRGTDDAALAAIQTALDYDNTIWVDPDGGTDGSTNGTHGKRSAPCKTWANVASLLTARNLTKVRVVGSGSLQVNAAISTALSIELDPQATLSFVTGASIQQAAGSVGIRGGRTVNTSSHTLTVADLANLHISGVSNVSGSYSGSTNTVIRWTDCVIRSDNLSLANSGVTVLKRCSTAAHSRSISSSAGHLFLYDWEGEVTVNSTGTGHAHVSGRSDDLTLTGDGSIHLTGEIVYDASGFSGTLDASGITAKQGADGDTLKTLSDQVDGVAGLSAQGVRDAMKLAPTAGAPAAGSVDAHLDDVPKKSESLTFTRDDAGEDSVSVTITDAE
jgi:hypothetical protein